MHIRSRLAAANALGLATVIMLSGIGARLAWGAAPADLQVRAVAKTFQVGMPGLYTITVASRGPSDTNDVITLTDQLPPGLHFSSFRGTGWTCAVVGQLVTCTFPGALAANSTLFAVLGVSVDNDALPAVTNTFHLSYAGETNTANNSYTKFTSVKPGRFTPSPGTPTRTPTKTPTGLTPTITPTGAATATASATRTPVPAATDLLLTKTISGTFRVGSNGGYLLSVSNLGPADTNVAATITDPLPNGLSFVSATGAGWACAAASGVVTCTHADPIATGSSSGVTLIVGISSAASPSVTNTATLAYPGDTNPANNTARKPTTIRP